jgi:hypothetical protein
MVDGKTEESNQNNKIQQNRTKQKTNERKQESTRAELSRNKEQRDIGGRGKITKETATREKQRQTKARLQS